MGPGVGGFDLVGWTRTQLWERQVPATVTPGPAGGVALWLETGQQIVLPDGAAVGYFLAGWEASERAAAGMGPELPTEQTTGDEGDGE